MPKEWYVYMVECADGTLYSGVTTDVERRIKEHNDSPKGAKYTRAKRPVVLVYTETCVDRTEATRREYTLKQLSRDEKLKLIYTDPK
ncbi:MAG: GIY-YIG nuclease family protein [Candidatus Pacebacteria bacterium]|nr:GIY-YIG nuclease family protein [Candidatus Paceibacterota bacterium]